jgi:hypothetical protein
VKLVSGVRDGVARLQGDTLVKGRYAHRVGFAVSRSYRGTVTISAGALSFLRAERVSIRAAKHRSVRKASAKLLLPGPGCYTLLARGPGWRQRFTFAAR